MNKKYQVFVSSTYKDLQEARAKVRDAILSMYHFPVGMELFGAANEEQWQIISETIDSSDYYVLIIGQRYGSLIPEGFPDAGISYTEKEFRYALEKGVPILAFLLDDDVAVKPEYMETENCDKLSAFKTAVKTGRLVEWWKTSDELAQKVSVALYKQTTRTKRPGWIRGDAVDIEKSLKALTELTEQNQKLAEENRTLLIENQSLKQKSERVPKLIVALDGDTQDEGEQKESIYKRAGNIEADDDNNIHLKVGKVDKRDAALIEADYRPISKADFIGALRGKVSAAEIEEYNKSLPSKTELEEYLSRYHKYHMIVDSGIASVISVHNIGTAKATDVSVRIKCPDEIRVLDIDEVRKMEEPKAPRKPRNLQEVAYERAYRAETALTRTFAQYELIDKVKPISWPDFREYVIHDDGKAMDIYENMVGIEIKNGIVHTKWYDFRGVYIVPMKKGKFKAKVEFMCAEYVNPDEVELTFICE